VSAYTLSHLSDPVLLRALATLVAEARATTAARLAHLAERPPQPDLPARLEAMAPARPIGRLVPEPVGSRGPGERQLVPEPVAQHAPGRVAARERAAAWTSPTPSSSSA
jgi:hypothetical protein